jgi:predicted secreted acid phosphatase
MSSIALPLGVFFAGLFLIVGKEDSLVSVPGELDRARTLCIEWISKLPKGSMIVFDFDDTLFDPNTVIGHVHSGGRDFAHGDRKALPLYKPIRQVCDVLKYATSAGMYITLITARPNTNTTRSIVMANFKHNNLSLHEYHANDHYPKLQNFKAILRKNISIVRPIGLTIGDQWTDVNESTYNWVKLPTQKDPVLYTSFTN